MLSYMVTPLYGNIMVCVHVYCLIMHTVLGLSHTLHHTICVSSMELTTIMADLSDMAENNHE